MTAQKSIINTLSTIYVEGRSSRRREKEQVEFGASKEYIAAHYMNLKLKA